MLKLYPAGITKATISRGTPKTSIASIARGRAASDVLVAKAILTGSDTAFRNRRRGRRAHPAIGNNTANRKAKNAPYAVNSSLARGSNAPVPMWPTVYAIAAPTPNGAKYITMFVKKNITWVRELQKFRIGARLATGTRDNATPNST